MTRCAFCDRVIVFGGRRHGNVQCCSKRCLLRLLILEDNRAPALSGVGDVIVELRDDVDTLMREMADQRAAVADALERLDFLERALVQSRDTARHDSPVDGYVSGA